MSNKQSVNIHLSKAYLEMARSYVNARCIYREDLISDQTNIHNTETIRFAFASLSVIYSYLAIEAFMNWAIHEIWKDVRNKNISFYNKEEIENFEKLFLDKDAFETVIKNPKLKELKDRINIVCRITNIKKICEKDGKLWTSFTALHKQVRHNLVHPNSQSEIFSENTKKIMPIKAQKEFSEIASKIITHFYTASKYKGHVPNYLKNNTLFEISEIKLLL